MEVWVPRLIKSLHREEWMRLHSISRHKVCKDPQLVVQMIECLNKYLNNYRKVDYTRNPILPYLGLSNEQIADCKHTECKDREQEPLLLVADQRKYKHVKHSHVHHVRTLFTIELLLGQEINSIKYQRIDNREHCRSKNCNIKPPRMIAKVLAQAFDHIDTQEVEPRESPFKFTALWVEPWIKIGRANNDWERNCNGTYQEGYKSAVFENLNKEQWDPANRRCVSHHKLDWNQGREYSCMRGKFVIDFLVEPKCNNRQDFFDRVGKGSTYKWVLDSVSQVKDEGDHCCFFTHCVLTNSPEVQVSHYNQERVDHVWAHSDSKVGIETCPFK